MKYRVVLLSLLLLAAGLHADGEAPADPLPLRRVLLPPERVAAALQRVKDGVLVRLPRAEFEALARAAGRRRDPPRLVEARYRARLVDGPALAGTAQWKALHSGDGPALLRLNGGGAFNLALSKPRFENRDAVLAEFPEPDGLALLLDRPGEHTVTVDWSARVEARPEGLQADLRLPACPAARLEIDLPADHSLAALDGTLVSGPHPAESADRRLWKVAAGGKAHLPLLLRRGGAGEPVVFARARTAQKLSPDGLESVTTFAVEAPHHELRELVCECDAALRPVEVSAAGLEGWEVKGNQVIARLARPARQVSLEVRCLAPLGRPGPAGSVRWVSPAVRLVGSVPRGESLELWLHPELRVGAWDSGDFRLASIAPFVDPERGTKGQRLTLLGGGLAPGGKGPAAPRRPAATVRAGGVEFSARQQTWWQLGAGRAALSSQVAYEVRSGLLFELRLRLPAGWDSVEAVELAPEGLLRNWGVRKDAGGPLLQVDLRRPLRPASAGTLTVRLRGPSAESLAGRWLPFPDLAPLGALARAGGLAIDYDERAYRAEVQTSAVSGEPAAGPWGPLVPDFFYPIRGEPVAGALRLRGRPPRMDARARSDVFVSGGRVALQTRLTLEGEGGRPGHVDVYQSVGGATDWRAERSAGAPANRVERVERQPWREAAAALAALAATSPLSAATIQAARPPGTFWRLSLERPLEVRESLTLRADRVLEAEGDPARPRWVVPLPLVVGAGRQEGEVVIHLADSEPVALDAAGLRPGPRPPQPTAWRAFRYGGLWARLTALARGDRGGPAPEAFADRAWLVTALTPGGDLRHHFRFRLAGWPQRTFPVRLPPNAVFQAAGIDGRWLAHLRPPDDGAALELPVPVGGAAVFEVVYTSATEAGLWQRLAAPAPALPVAPADFRRLWLLPPGLVPLSDAGLQRPAGAAPRRRPFDLFRVGGALPLPGGGDEVRARQQALAEVAASLRSERNGKTLRLDALIREVAFEYLKGPHPLVVDREALARAGVGPATPVTVKSAGPNADRGMPWEGLGLSAVACRSGVLLTERGVTAEQADELDAAVARAVRVGRDPSGRLLSALEWLGEAPAAAPAGLFGVGRSLEGWSEWESVAGGGETELVVVHPRLGDVLGVALTGVGVALLVLVLVRRRPAGRYLVLLLAWLGAAGLALAWLPAALIDVGWWPLAGGLLVALVWFLIWAGQAPPRRATPSTAGPGRPLSEAASGSTGTAILLLGLGLSAAGAQQAEPETVYVVRSGGEESVLVTPTLLGKLRAMARPAAPTAVVPLSAVYDGKLVGGRPEFEATFEVYAPADGAATLTLPLEGVQLIGDVLLDGARVYPEALPAGRSGYTLRVRGRGRHKVELRFRAALSVGESGQRRVQFGAPRLVQSRLTFQAPAGAAHLQAVAKHGGQRVVAQPAGPRLEAELGAIAVPVQLRWYEGQAARPPRVEFREAYLWDLAADASTLTALVRYAISDGAVSSLTVDLPAELEVMAAQARRPAALGEAAVRLSDWGVRPAAGGRTLRLDFPAPVSGAVEVMLELAPRRPWLGAAVLALPRPHGEPARGESGQLAYRTRGVEVTSRDFRHLTGIHATEFAPFWPAATRPAAAGLASASKFDRREAAPQLRLTLRPAAGRPDATQRLRLDVGARQAGLTAQIELKAPGLSLLEWDMVSTQPVTVTDVRGADVARWHSDGRRLTVWLDRTVDATRLEVSAWVPLVPLPAGKPPAALARLNLPMLRPARSAPVRTEVTLTPGPGLTLAPEGPPRQLTPESKPSARELRYTTRQTSYGGAFLVRPGKPPAARVATRIRVEGREVTFISRVEYELPGELKGLSLRLRDWEGDAQLVVSAHSVARREQVRRVGGRRERTWTLELPPGVRDRFRVEVRGRLPLDEAAAGMPMPDVVVVGAVVQRLLEVGAGLTAESPAGVVAVGAAAWRVTDAEWGLRLVPRPGPAVAPAEVLLAQRRATVTDGRRWLHECVWWLRHEGPAELGLRWPDGVEVVGVAVDGAAVPAMRPEQGRLWLPLSGSGSRRVRVRWRAGPGEALARPALDLPQLEGVRPGPTIWTVDVPAGWDLPAGGLTGPTRRAAVELYRAAAALAAGDEARLGRGLWLASLAVDAGADPHRRVGPDGSELAAWLKQLRGQAEGRSREPAGDARRREVAAATPVSWVSQRGAPVPDVRLVPAREKRLREAVAFSGQWVVALLLVWTVTLSAVLRWLARWLWPEEALLLGVLGWQVAGPTVVVLFLLALGAVGRLLLLGAGLRRLLRR